MGNDTAIRDPGEDRIQWSVGERWHVMNGDELTVWVNLHAIAMLALPAGTVALLVFAKRRVPQPIHVLVATGVASIVGFNGYSCRHRCNAGDPVLQWIIPTVCIWLILMFMADAVWRRATAAFVLISMWFLCLQYNSWVHEPGWAGDPERIRRGSEATTSHAIEDTEAFLVAKEPTDPTDYAPCWLADLPPIKAEINGNRKYLSDPSRFTFHSCWHTGFTRLFRATSEHREFWYLGGPIKNARGRIIVKDRPSNSSIP